MKFKILILFILFSSVVLGAEDSKVIDLNLQSDNLTIQIEDQFWWFNISGGNLDVSINHTYDIGQGVISNCSQWFDFNWNTCFNINDNLRSIQTRLEKQLAGCVEPTAENVGNPQCWEKKVELKNKTVKLDTCQTSLTSTNSEKTTAQENYNNCVTERDDKFDKNNTIILFLAIVVVGGYVYFKQIKGKTTDQNQIERKKGGPDMDGIDKQQLADDMKRRILR